MSKAGEKPHKIHLETWRKRNWLSTIWADPSYSVNRKYIADVKAVYYAGTLPTKWKELANTRDTAELFAITS